MAKYSPLSRLLGNIKEEDEDNIYDDGSIWTKPEDTTFGTYTSPVLSSSSSRLGLSSLPGNISNEVVDPLQNPRNQINYYTNELNELGQEVKEPGIWSKLGSLGVSALTRIGAVSGAVSNTMAGAVDDDVKRSTEDYVNITNSDEYKQVKAMGFEPKVDNYGIWSVMPSEELYNSISAKEFLELEKEATKLLNKSSKENSRNVLEKTVDKGKSIGAGLKSGASTLSGLWTGEYSDENVDWGRVLDNNRDNPNENVSGNVALLEAPGYYGYKMFTAPANNKWDWSGADEETAQNWGNIVADLGLSILEGNVTDIDGAGKTIKALRNGGKLDDIAKVNKLDDALELAKKYNSYDDYVSSLGEKASKYSDEALEGMYNKSLNTYAQDLMKDVNKGLGGINNFEGLKLGKNTILNPEQISNISKNKIQSSLLQVGLGLYSPVGALMSNPVTDGLNKVIDKTETGTALKKDINKLFGGGKNNEWITAMKDNPSKALEYANERKQVDIAKKMSDKRVQEVMDTIHKYSDMKETPEELTKIIEEPTTRATRQVQVEKEINNPEYISKMMKLGKNEYNKQVSSIKTLQNKLKSQKDELLATAKKEVKTGTNETINKTIEGIDSEISNLQKRLEKIESIGTAKSLDFNKQMKKFGYEDDYTDMFDKAISTNIETLAKEVGDRDLAEALQESANRVLDQLDEQFPGLSKNFTTYTKIDKNKVLSGATDNFEGEDLIERAKKVGIKYDASEVIRNEKYREKFEKAIDRREKELLVWEDFSKKSGMFEEGSGDVVTDVMDRAYKRRHEVYVDPMQYKDKFKEELLELQELQRPRTAFEIETDTAEEIADRKKRIRSLKSKLKSTEASNIEKYGTINYNTGEIYNELNSRSTEELQQLTLKLNKDELDKYRKLEKVVKQEEIIGLGYLGKKDAKKLAPRLKEELGLKESIAQIEKGLMLDGSKYVDELKSKIYRNSFETVMNLTDDEFDIISRQLELRQPINFSYKEPGNKFDNSVKGLNEEEELSNILAKQRESDANVTSTGQNRETFIDDMEFERLKAKKPQEYMGDIEDGMAKNKQLEQEDRALIKQYQKNQRLYDKLVEKHGKEKGLELYNQIRTKEAKAQREALDKAIKENNITREVARQNRLISNQDALQEVAVSADKIIPLNGKNVLGKSIRRELPDDMKDMVGIKLNTANGEIVIDKNINTKELKTILDTRTYGNAEKGSKIIYTNSAVKGDEKVVGIYAKNSDTVMINLSSLNKKQAQTILEHELGHRIFYKLNKKYPNLAPETMVKPFIDFIKTLDDKGKETFMEIVGRTNKANMPTKEMLEAGSITKYLNSVKRNAKNKFTVSNEGFAELFSLYNNRDKVVVRKMKELNEIAYDTFISRIDNLKPDEIKEISSLARKRFGDDYANQLLELKNKREAVLNLEGKINNAAKINEVMEKASDINKTNIKIDELEKDLKNLELSMDKHEFDDNGNIISTDYDTFFDEMKKRNPKAVAEIDKRIPQYKKMIEPEDKIFEIDNTKNLTPEAREYMDKFKATMKDIAIREGIYDPEDAEAFTTYVMHEINPKYADEGELVEKGRKLKEELQDPLNVHKLSRKKKGTVQQINAETEAQMGIRLYEENINRLFLKRAMDSKQTIFKKETNDRLLKGFSIPIVGNFDKHINSVDHIMEYYGKDLVKKLGISKKEIKAIFKESGSTSFEFMKQHFFDDFKKTIPDLKSFKKTDDFIKYLDGQEYEGFYKGRMIKAFKEGKLDTVEDLMFENAYPMTNKFNYARSLREKYGYAEYYKEPLKNIPKTTEDGRPYVFEAKKDLNGNEVESKVDRTKEMPYDIEGKVTDSTDEIRAYTQFIYKEAKNKNMIIVELPKEKPETVVRRTISNKAMEQAVKDRTSVAENISMLMKGDKEAIEGFDALAGYNVIDPKLIKEEEFILDSGTNKILVDKNAWENYKKALKDSEYKEKNALLKVYDYFNNMFKSQALFSAGFHIRNSIQNVIASYVKTGINLLDAKKNKEALEMLLYNKGKLKNLDVTYGGYNVDEILREAEFGGIFETEVKNLFDKDNTKKFLKGETDKLTKKKYSLGQSVNPFGTDFIGYRASNKLGGAIEEQAKMVNIITHLESGMNLSDAIQLTKDTLFDYSDLTQFESKVMKRVMPFYTFMRKNIPSQIENMADHTARFNRVERVYNKASEKNETDRERALRPDYLDGQLALGGQKYINLGNASADLKKLVNPLEMGSGLNPVIKTPLELIFNKQMYSGSDISKYDKPTEKLKYTIESSIPITKQVNALHKLITGTEIEQSKAQKTLSRVAGNMINTYDIDKQEKATMYDYIEELQNQYYEYLEKNPEAKAQVEAEAKKAKSKSYESPISKLLKKR